MEYKLFVETSWNAEMAIEEIEKEIHANAVEVMVIENGDKPLLDAFISDCKTLPEDALKNFFKDNGYILLKKIVKQPNDA